MKLRVVDNLECPNCGAPELHPDHSNDKPVEEWIWVIRPFKVTDLNNICWSQCMVCAGAWSKDAEDTLISTPENLNRDKGWFS